MLHNKFTAFNLVKAAMAALLIFYCISFTLDAVEPMSM